MNDRHVTGVWRWVLAACVGVLMTCGMVPAAHAVSSSASAPPGVNNWACKPSAAHPRPVVLVHGLSANGFNNWAFLGPLLVQRGYCVYSLTYGVNPALSALAGTPLVVGGANRMEDSALELDAFVSRVLKATGTSRIDLVGHSEGTIVPQYWLKFDGGAPKVDHYVAMTPIYHGTTFQGVSSLVNAGYQNGLGSAQLVPLFNSACASCTELLEGSAFMKKLQPGGAPGVRYTTIMTKYDELVTPYTSGYMPGAVHNFVLQDLCAADPSEHLAVAFDPIAAQLTLNALDPAHAQAVDCTKPATLAAFATTYASVATTYLGGIGAPAAAATPRAAAAVPAPSAVQTPRVAQHATVPRPPGAGAGAREPDRAVAGAARTVAHASQATEGLRLDAHHPQRLSAAETGWIAAVALAGCVLALLGLRRRHPR